MLLRFGVSNYLSIKQRQELSMVASSLDDAETGLLASPVPNVRLLPVAAIYGANASGKSNIVSSMAFMRSCVLYSHSRGDPRGGVNRSPFALEENFSHRASAFDADFIVENVRYHYEFEADNESFTSEMLTAYPNDRRQVLFRRDGMEFVFGRNLRGRNKTIAELTRPNSLFLAAAAQNGHDQLLKVVEFFQAINICSMSSTPAEFLVKNVDKRTIRFLSSIETGITDFRRIEREPRELPAELVKDFSDILRKHLGDRFEPDMLASLEQKTKLQLAHTASDGRLVYFDFQNESEGTMKILVLLGAIFESLDSGGLLVVDELGASLHTQATESLLALFYSPHTNRTGAQLIATTHDTNLLRSRFLRRDQIWFVEKSPAGDTCLYPLTDIYTRKGDNIARGYLQGRYGAVPLSGFVEVPTLE